MLADIGVSSMMLDDPERGFSFMREGPLDMRMDRNQPLTASDIVNTYGEKEIADILYIYGEERRSRPIARSIVRSRPLATTFDLVPGGRARPGRPPLRADPSGDPNVSGVTDRGKRGVGQPAGVSEFGSDLPATGRPAGRHHLSFSGRPDREKRLSGVCDSGQAAHKEGRHRNG